MIKKVFPGAAATLAAAVFSILLAYCFSPVRARAAAPAASGVSQGDLSLADQGPPKGAQLEHYHGPMTRGPKDLARSLAEAKSQHIPLTPAQILPPLPPASENAAPLYVQISRIPALGPGENADWDIWFRLEDSSDKPRPSDLAAVRQLLREEAPVLGLARRAALRPRCVFRHNWADGAWILLPEYAAIRRAQRILLVQSYVLSRDGRFADAAHADALALGIARHAASEPLTVPYLTGLACKSIAMRGIMDLLRAARNRPHIARLVERVVRSNPIRFDLVRVLEGDMILARASMHKLRTTKDFFRTLAEIGALGGSDSTDTPQDYSARKSTDPGLLQGGFFEDWLDEAESIVIHDNCALIQAARVPANRSRAAIYRAVDRIEARDRRDAPRGSMWEYPELIMDDIFDLDQTTGLVDRQYQSMAQTQVVLAAAAILAYRAAHGTLPRRLADAVSPVPMDPFTGGPIAYRREGAGFVVYSRGPDGTFDGGEPGQRDFRQSFFRE